MKFIGERSVGDGKVAMEAAVAHYVEFAEPPTAAALAHRLGEESDEKPKVKRYSFVELEGHLCPACREVVSLMEASSGG